MVNMEFGKNIEKLIQFSGQKNYSLAKELGYDVSYISKWISGAMLPASKNIKNICEKTAKFVVDNATEIHKCEILAYYKLDIIFFLSTISSSYKLLCFKFNYIKQN